MKFIIQTILAIALLIFSISLHSQTNGTNGKPEQPKVIMPPDSIAIISLRDYDTFYKFLQDNVVKSKYDKLTPLEVLEFFHQWAVFEYNRKKKK